MGKNIDEDYACDAPGGHELGEVAYRVLRDLATGLLQLTPFEQIPDTFLWIELGHIGRQTFQVNACSPTRCQKVFDRLAAMDGGTILDDK